MFEESDYKRVVAKMIEKNRGLRGYQRQLAKACGCHTSFISQVLRSHVHLTPDHAASLAEFWGLNDLERDYLIALVQFARSSSKAYKKYLQEQLRRLRNEHKSVTTRMAKSKEKDENEGAKAFYYSSWHVMAIHVLCSVEGMNNVGGIAERLRLPVDFVSRTLKQLTNFGYLQETRDGYQVTNKDLHLSGRSPLIAIHHGNWRTHATNRLPTGTDESMHYSGVMAISRSDFELIKENLLKFLESTKKIVTKSPEEDVYCLGLDFYPL